MKPSVPAGQPQSSSRDCLPSEPFSAETVIGFTGQISPGEAKTEGSLPSPPLVLSEGDLITVTNAGGASWWRGKLRDSEGWFPSSCVRVIDTGDSKPPQQVLYDLGIGIRQDTDKLDPLLVPGAGTQRLEAVATTDPGIRAVNLVPAPSNHESGMSWIVGSRKNSQFSNHSSSSSEPTEVEFDDDLANYRTIETADYAAFWIPYNNGKGGIVYVDPVYRVIARSLAPNTNTGLRPVGHNQGDLRSYQHAGHLLAGESSQLETAEDPHTPVSLWFNITRELEIPKLDTWDETLDAAQKALSAMRDGTGTLASLAAHVQALGLAAGIPAGVLPIFDYGTFAANYRLVTNTVIVIYVNVARGFPIEFCLDTLERYLEDFSKSHKDLCKAMERPSHVPGGYNAKNQIPDSFSKFSFGLSPRQDSESVETSSFGESPAGDSLSHDQDHSASLSSVQSPAASRDSEKSILSAPSSEPLRSGTSRATLSELAQNLRSSSLTADDTGSSDQSISTKISIPLVGSLAPSAPTDFIEVERYVPECIMTQATVKGIQSKQELLRHSIAHWGALEDEHRASESHSDVLNVETPESLLSEKSEQGTQAEVLYNWGVTSVISIFRSIISVLDSIDFAPFFSRACEGKLNERDTYVQEYLFRALKARHDLYFILRSMESPSNIRKSQELALRATMPEIDQRLNEFVDAITQLKSSGSVTSRLFQFDQITSEVVYARDGALKGGTKQGLVQQITLHSKRKNGIVTPFLTTFQCFMSEVELLQLLIRRFKVETPRNMDAEQLQQWHLEVVTPVRLRVFNVLKQWFEQRWITEPNERLLADREQFWNLWDEFLGFMREQAFFGAGVLQSVGEARKNGTYVSSVRRVALSSVPPEVVYDATADLSLDTIKPIELARQMTLLKSEIYRNISREELIGRYVSSVATTKRALSSFAEHWNQETSWISMNILSESTATARASRISYFISVGWYLRTLNNFSSMMAVNAALQSAGIHRLKKTWSHVSKECLVKYNEMLRIMSSSRNFATYRDALSLTNEAAVPFFGVFLMDLQFACDGNPDTFVDREDLINMGKWSSVAGIMEESLRFQNMTYQLQPLERIQQFVLHNLKSSTPLHEQYDLSLEREPREVRTTVISHVN